MSLQHHYQSLVDIFDATFYQQYNTRLVKGDGEPVYLPADEQYSYHRIIFAHGFFASGLHEIAHWLVAGQGRRLLEDFGYWYAPDGRNAQQQSQFEQVEVRPQAIEWALSVACGFEFNVSCDNLNGEQPDRFAFQAKVQAQVLQFVENGFPKRTAMLLKALSDFYQTPYPSSIEQFSYQQELCIE